MKKAADFTFTSMTLRNIWNGRRSRMSKKHQIYYPARGDEQPEITCCLFHPEVPALTKKTVRDSNTGKFYQYGLCKDCEFELLMNKKRFAQEISDKLEKVLAAVYKNKGGS